MDFLDVDDGIVSTASLVIGVTAVSAARSGTLVAGIAGLGASGMSMATGRAPNSRESIVGAGWTLQRPMRWRRN